LTSSSTLGGHADTQGQDHDADDLKTHRGRLYGQSQNEMPPSSARAEAADCWPLRTRDWRWHFARRAKC